MRSAYGPSRLDATMSTLSRGYQKIRSAGAVVLSVVWLAGAGAVFMAEVTISPELGDKDRLASSLRDMAKYVGCETPVVEMFWERPDEPLTMRVTCRRWHEPPSEGDAQKGPGL